VRDLLVVVLEVGPARLSAWLAEVDRPGEVLRESVVERGADLVADAAAALTQLTAGDLAPRLLALAVALDADAGELPSALADAGELRSGWPLPASLPVVAAAAADWAAQGAPAERRPLVAGAAVAAAKSVGAHAHLPHA
jgi:hypothetical protein